MAQVTISMGDKKAVITFKCEKELPPEEEIKILKSLRADCILNLMQYKNIELGYPINTDIWDGKKYLEAKRNPF